MSLFCFNPQGMVVSIPYNMHDRACSEGIRLNETTLQSTIDKARRYCWKYFTNREQHFNDKLFELLKEEANEIVDYPTYGSYFIE